MYWLLPYNHSKHMYHDHKQASNFMLKAIARQTNTQRFTTLSEVYPPLDTNLEHHVLTSTLTSLLCTSKAFIQSERTQDTITLVSTFAWSVKLQHFFITECKWRCLRKSKHPTGRRSPEHHLVLWPMHQRAEVAVALAITCGLIARQRSHIRNRILWPQYMHLLWQEQTS